MTPVYRGNKDMAHKGLSRCTNPIRPSHKAAAWTPEPEHRGSFLIETIGLLKTKYSREVGIVTTLQPNSKLNYIFCRKFRVSLGTPIVFMVIC